VELVNAYLGHVGKLSLSFLIVSSSQQPFREHYGHTIVGFWR
jgi:hypothetical protein